MKRFALIVLFACLVVAAAQSQTLTGVVTNGTTHKPASGDDVVLLKLGQGMEEEARTKTNARGEFKLKVGDPNALHLIRVRHDSVNYHEAARPGAKSVQITVYNAAAKVAGLKLLDQSEVYQAKGNELQIIELFRLSNTSSPPLTQPAFEFYLPEGANPRMGQAVWGSGMPIQTAPIPQKTKNKYAFLYPLRPGVTQFELVYTMPYSGKISINPKLEMAADHFYVVTAKGIQFASGTGATFQAADHWPTDPSITGVDVHSADDVSPAQQLSFELSGNGLLPEQDTAAQGSQQSREDNRPGGGLGVPNEKPDPLHSGQWFFLGVLSLFLAAGAVFVYTANHPAAVADQTKNPQNRPTMLLEAMKEEIFQLESDRLQGKISPKEYDSAKAALDKTLQRAVQRQQTK